MANRKELHIFSSLASLLQNLGMLKLIKILLQFFLFFIKFFVWDHFATVCECFYQILYACLFILSLICMYLCIYFWQMHSHLQIIPCIIYWLYYFYTDKHFVYYCVNVPLQNYIIKIWMLQYNYVPIHIFYIRHCKFI